MIRTPNHSDFDSIMALATACGLFEPDQTQLLANMLQAPDKNDVWFLDDQDGQPIGVAYLAPEKMTHGTWNLYWIAVHPDHQRRGHGQALLQHIEEWLTERGERLLLIETAGVDSFDYVRTFYMKNGFEWEACVRDFYEEAVDKIVFRKVLKRRSGVDGRDDER